MTWSVSSGTFAHIGALLFPFITLHFGIHRLHIPQVYYQLFNKTSPSRIGQDTMTPTQTPPLALPKIPYLLWGIIEPLCFLRDLFSSVPNLQPIHVERLTLLQTLFTFIIPRSRDVTLLKCYLWVMLLVNDLP